MPARQTFSLHPQPLWGIFKLHLFVGGWRVICTQKTTLGANSMLPPPGFQGLSSGHQSECVFCKLFYSAALAEWSRFSWISPIGPQSDLGYWIIRIFAALRWEGKPAFRCCSKWVQMKQWTSGKVIWKLLKWKIWAPFQKKQQEWRVNCFQPLQGVTEPALSELLHHLYREWRNQLSPSALLSQSPHRLQSC